LTTGLSLSESVTTQQASNNGLRQALAKPNEQARAANPNGKAPSRHSPFHHTEKEAHQTTYQGEDFALFFLHQCRLWFRVAAGLHKAKACTKN